MTALRAATHALGVLALGAALLIGCGGSGDEPVADAVGDTAAATVESTSVPDAVGAEDDGPTFHPDDNPEALSQWGQLVLTAETLSPGRDVVPYTLRSALFSDHALKLRTVWLPDGSAPADYHPDDVFDFPVGTVITKTFYYPRADTDIVDAVARPAERNDTDTPLSLDRVRLIETRVLVHRASGWEALPYVWNDDQTEAHLQRTGDLLSLTLADADDTAVEFPYVVPNVNQCAGCHATNHTTKALVPIGPKARHLNLEVALADAIDQSVEPVSQLDLWANLGLLTGLPAPAERPVTAAWDDETAPLDDRARAYLDINCAHCHNTNGPADTSGLFLEASTDVGPKLGVCKPPVAAGTGTGGRRVGINPGQPDDSIFVFRMQTDDPGAMMPELGRAVVHDDGVELIADWIASLGGTCS